MVETIVGDLKHYSTILHACSCLVLSRLEEKMDQDFLEVRLRR